jgi:hypothetical protein
MEFIKGGLSELIKVVGLSYTQSMRALPDSLLLGSGLFAIFTQNFPIGILVLAMMEWSVLTWLLVGVTGSLENNTESVNKATCFPGIPSPFLVSFVGELYPKVSFPSIPILFISSTLFYILQSVMNFTEELKELGNKDPEWKMRLPLSVIFTSIILMGFVFWRVLNSCDDVTIALGSVGLGAVFGGLINLLHVYLFGRDSINFLGLPLLADRAANGGPLYACAKKS